MKYVPCTCTWSKLWVPTIVSGPVGMIYSMYVSGKEGARKIRLQTVNGQVCTLVYVNVCEWIKL